MIREKKAGTVSGWLMLPLLIAAIWGLIVRIAQSGTIGPLWIALILLVACIISRAGLFVVNPNEARAVLLFGSYLGTARDPGFHWTNPFTARPKVSLRIRNFESAKLKVNDHVGNPIEIAAVVVWRVVDTAEALFEVDNYDNFVHVQSES